MVFYSGKQLMEPNSDMWNAEPQLLNDGSRMYKDNQFESNLLEPPQQSMDHSDKVDETLGIALETLNLTHLDENLAHNVCENVDLLVSNRKMITADHTPLPGTQFSDDWMVVWEDMEVENLEGAAAGAGEELSPEMIFSAFIDVPIAGTSKFEANLCSDLDEAEMGSKPKQNGGTTFSEDPKQLAFVFPPLDAVTGSKLATSFKKMKLEYFSEDDDGYVPGSDEDEDDQSVVDITRGISGFPGFST